MDLRAAERQKWLRSLPHKRYSTILETARIRVETGAEMALSFAPGLTVLSGGNGAGKSSLLSALWHSLTDEGMPRRVKENPVWISQIIVDGESSGAPWRSELIAAEVAPTGPRNLPFEVLYLDPSSESEDVVRRLRSDPAHGDLLEGVDAAEFSDDLRDMASYLLRRSYQEIRVFEITGLDSDDTPVPYFSATVSGLTYNSLEMGRGELSALHLLWKLSRADRGTLVLLEEPESHLATYSHDALVYIVVKLVLDGDLTVVCASHSPSFFARLPERSVFLVSSFPVPSVTTTLTAGEIARHLGIGVEPSLHSVVEDECAAILFSELLQLVDPGLRDRVTVSYSTEGESGVARIGRTLRSVEGASSIVSILDGDQRSIVPDGSCIFLPGSEAPERVLRDLVDRWRSGELEWVVPLPGGVGRFSAVVGTLDGLDHHDWLDALSSEYGGKAHVVRAMAPMVLNSQPEKNQLEELAESLRRRLR